MIYTINLKVLPHLLKLHLDSQAWWHMPVIPTGKEIQVGGSWSKVGLGQK
jgi:hypothetical protein